MLSKRKNIILCGFMGCGKSTVGKMLAHRLLYRFVDSDEFIERTTGMTIPEIFKAHGEQYFRDAEYKALCELAAKSNCVIAAGGGALIHDRNVEALSQNGIIVYINTSFENCWLRIKNTTRPLVASNTQEQIKLLYNTRAERYKAVSQIEVENNVTPYQATVDILNKLSGDLIINDSPA